MCRRVSHGQTNQKNVAKLRNAICTAHRYLHTQTHIRTRTHSDLNRCVKNIKYNKTIEWETVLVHVVASVVSIASLSRHRHDSRARSCVILITDDGWSSFNASSITRYVINFVLLHRRPSVSTESIILHLSRPSSPPPI